MKNLSFEIHRYAPELSKVMLNGVDLNIKLPYSAQNTPSRKSLVRAVRADKRFSNNGASKRFAAIKKVYTDDKNKWLNSTVQGSFTETKTVIKMIDKLYEPESILLDGTTLPQPKILVRFSKTGAWQDVTHIGVARYKKGLSKKPAPLKFS